MVQRPRTTKSDTNKAKKSITVKIGAFPGGQIKSYTFPDQTSYKDGLGQAGLLGNDGSGKGLDVRVNGTPISNLTGAMADGDQVLVFSKVRGN